MKQRLLNYLKSHHIGSKLRFFQFLFSNKLNVPMLRLLWAAFRNNSWMRNCAIIDQGKNNSIVIGQTCCLSGVRFFMEGDNNSIIIGNNVSVNASKQQPTCLNACEGTSIRIDDDCLFSNNIEIHTTDYHVMYNTQHLPTNSPCDVHIGKHCWIGLRAILLKGVVLQENTIVGACSTVTHSVDKSNVVIAGNPARIVKNDVFWEK